jgi:GNAT superfamily N-acetyltransferase
MNIIEVTRQSPRRQVADAATLLIEQMKVIGAEVDDNHVETALENALKAGSSARFFLGYHENRAAACCLLNIGSGIEAGGDYAWINEIHVTEEYRRMGIGKALLSHVLRWAEERGYRYIASVTSPNNRAARQLFERQGFDSSDMIWLKRQT